MVMITRNTRWIIGCAFFCTACVPNKAYRIAYPAGQPAQVNPPLYEQETVSDCGQNSQPGKEPYHLAFIEFDDRGEMFDRRQLANALQMIRDAKAAAAKMPLNSQGLQPQAVVFTFIHGWKNNAADRSGNVWGFRKTLACLGSNYDPAPVVGVFIGWRGAVLSPPLLKELTFYDRRDKSENIAGAHMIESLLGIMRTAKGDSFGDQTISVLIGHSFGGGVLETALTQTIENMILNTAAGNPVRWPANLVVFVNEAAPAIIGYQLIESMTANLQPRPACGGDFGPVILSISSTGDYATGAFFPLVQAISRPFNSLRHYPDKSNVLGFGSQGPMFFNTAAHLTAFQSHLLGLATDPDIDNAFHQCAPNVHSGMKSTIQNLQYRLVERPGTANLSPYWLADMPSTIVPDHSTIFNEAFRDFLLDLVTAQQFHTGVYIRK
jgi:hypothetical protein